ncbi:MAG: TolC family protein [Gammaproteobacteria bacterium]|nr:TolC family protein [Gammaproteobacteria bacterium]
MRLGSAGCRCRTFLLVLWLTLLASATAYAADRYVVVGSFSKLESALEAAERLGQQLGENLDVASVVRDDGILYRIVSGPYDQEKAISAKSKARQLGISGAWLWTDSSSDNILVAIDAAPVAEEDDPARIAPRIDAKTLESTEVVAVKQDKISLREAVQMALERNLGLLASRQQLAAGEAGVRQAKAGLYPSLISSIQQTAIDQDRAEASFGIAPEFRTTASLKLRQVIYSEDIKATYEIQKMLQSALTSDQQGIVLDTILNASSSYLALLRSKSLARIFEDDLRLTDSNYERAKIRLELGVANKAEVYRWETAQASSRKDLVLAQAAVERAKINLNMVLNQPLGKEFETINPTLEDSYLMMADPIVWERLKNDSRQRELKNFLAAEALLFAPELTSLREKQAAQRRALKAARRSITFPSVAFIVDGSKYLADEGKGTEQLSIDIPGTQTRFGGATDNVEWSAAIVATLPLYAGGERFARIEKARAQLAQIDLLYDDALLKTQAAVLSKTVDVRASLKNIDLSQDAVRASRNNLQLIIDSYERGVVTNIDLLDAQFALLSSELSAANTVYDFILEYLRLQRAVGNFDIVSTPDQIVKARQRMDQFYR